MVVSSRHWVGIAYTNTVLTPQSSLPSGLTEVSPDVFLHAVDHTQGAYKPRLSFKVSQCSGPYDKWRPLPIQPQYLL